MNFREALAHGFSRLHANPQLRTNALADSASLLLHTLGISRASLIANYERELTAAQRLSFDQVLARRFLNEPIQYIKGETEFYGLPLTVTPAVLIPRNSTEHVVEAVLDELRPRDAAGQMLRLVDVGTGSGAIAIALAHHLPRAQVIAADLSAEALVVAAQNAERNGVASRVRVLESDLLQALGGQPGFDAIISNPPYIPSVDRDTLHPEIRDFEPEVSLYGGAAGMDIYRRILPEAYAALKPGGLLALEIGRGQQPEIAALLAGWTSVRFVDDLLGIPRVALARRP